MEYYLLNKEIFRQNISKRKLENKIKEMESDDIISEQKLYTKEDFNESNDITKPSIIRLARRAGVKSISDECFTIIRKIIDKRLTDLIITALIVNSEHQTKTLMVDDIYDGLSLIGQNVTHSNDLGTGTCSK